MTLLSLMLFTTTASAELGAELLKNRAEGMSFYYEGDELKSQWNNLHFQDSIDFPSAASLDALMTPFLGSELHDEVFPQNFDGDYSVLAQKVAESWRLYHAGQYKDAYALANSLGLAGLLPKLRALAIHHHFFLEDKKARRIAFASLIKEIEHTQKKYQLELPALYLLKAFAIGRYGQEINPVKAFAKGLGGKLKRNIYRAAELAPDNNEAMMFKAVFDAEVVAHAGAVTGKILYGSSRSRAMEYFEKASKQNPSNTALLLEYGKACLKLCRKDEQAISILRQAAQIQPTDLADVQNIEMAKEVLEKQVAQQNLSLRAEDA